MTRIPAGKHTIRLFLDNFRATPDSAVIHVLANASHSATFVLERLSSAGQIVVESNPPGADIFLVDHQMSKNHTRYPVAGGRALRHRYPKKWGDITYSNTINVTRDSKLRLSAGLDVQNRVLLEAFANVSCTPCVEAAINLHTFVENTPSSDYAIIEYYANWPSPNDPFYKAAPDDVTERAKYYEVTTLPSLTIGGVFAVNAMQYDEIEGTFQSVYAEQSTPVGLSIAKSFVDGRLTVDVETRILPSCEYLDKLRLYVTIIEDNIHFDVPPGSNGLTEFNYVFRGFLSDRTGDLLDPRQQQQNFTYTFDWPDWNYSTAHIIAFIQNKETKQIFHTCIN